MTDPIVQRNHKIMRSLLRISFFALLVGWLLSACDEHTTYHAYLPTAKAGWGKGDTLFFSVPVKDTLPLLHVSVGVRNGSNYPYQNLYLFVSHNLEDSTSWKTDTLEFVIADEEGKWTGDGLGSLYQLMLPMTNVVARHPGNYTFKVAHGMKDERLNGISDVGIKINK